jgi:hypothetical protein
VACPAQDRDRERLEQELQSVSNQELLARLQRGRPFLRQFSTWADVLAFMRSGTSTDPRKDEILRPILAAHAEDQDPRWRVVLLAIFWPGLRSILRQKGHWDIENPDELWQRITWAFLQVICRVDVRRRPDRLVQKIRNDTFHRVYEEYRRDWDRVSREVRPAPKDPEDTEDPEAFDALVGGVEGIDFAGIELRQAQELEIKRLRGHLVAGRIAEADFLLLVGTRIYGQSVADYAREAGVAYQVAKKRRQRAEAAIRRFEEKEPVGPRRLSPTEDLVPPLLPAGEWSVGQRRR